MPAVGGKNREPLPILSFVGVAHVLAQVDLGAPRQSECWLSPLLHVISNAHCTRTLKPGNTFGLILVPLLASGEPQHPRPVEGETGL